jgi:hypothetical protein
MFPRTRVISPCWFGIAYAKVFRIKRQVAERSFKVTNSFPFIILKCCKATEVIKTLKYQNHALTVGYSLPETRMKPG